MTAAAKAKAKAKLPDGWGVKKRQRTARLKGNTAAEKREAIAASCACSCYLQFPKR